MNNPDPSPDRTSIPLYVDLDGTLIKSDILYESLFSLIKKNIFFIFYIPFWVLKGKAFFKHKISEYTDMNVTLLPYNPIVLEYLKNEKKKGRTLILATASNEKYAQKISDYLNIFSRILASTRNKNLSDANKLQAIKQDCKNSIYDYAGNSNADIRIFSEARKSILVNPAPGVKRKAAKVARELEILCEDKLRPVSIINAIRPHQWLKNSLLFVPIFTSHSWGQLDLLYDAFLAFISFSLCASGVYVFNDLLDLPSDRMHARKKYRAFASGDIPIQLGIPLFFILMLSGLMVGILVSVDFLIVLAGYLVLTTAYSTVLKTYVLIDVLTLASLYTFRIVGGAVAIDVSLSFWLLAFSIFFFLSLALVKRCAELISIRKRDNARISGRDYAVDDLGSLHSMGIASGYLSVFVVAFYINSSEVVGLYSRPQLLWLLAPALLYWISRMWIKTGRGEMHDDPLVYSVRDRASRLIMFFMFAVVFLST